MKAKELMVGNWAESPCKVFRVRVIDDVCQCWADAFKNAKPILLTQKLLDANDFVKSEYCSYSCGVLKARHAAYSFIEANGKRVVMVDFRHDGKISVEIAGASCFQSKKVKYVHELQNAMRICGIKKEIVIKVD